LLTAPRRLGRVNPALPIGAFVTDTLLVCGVFQTNEQETDADRVVVPLSSARRLFDYASEASAIEVALAPGADPEEAETRLRAMLGDGYEVADRLRQQEDSYRMIEIEKWITFAMLIFVLVMASFNVLSTMSMLMIEKAGNMHIMRAMGASDALLGRIFMLEGLLIAAVGGAAGIAAGVILSLLQQHLGIISLGGDHTQMSVLSYPCRLALPDVLLTAAAVTAIGFLSGLTASRKG
ncbi:MAG: FtsX-like permease family protein, partial [Duncaniella sp.]|nr:FtsX-like permease family protein [Duncaniella sp.]